MYQIKVSDTVIFSNKPDYSENSSGTNVLDPVLSLEINRAGSLTFTILPGGYGYSTSELDLLKQPVKVFQNDTQIFEGRVVQDEYDFYNKRKITCEGCLAYLNDYVFPSVYTNTTNAISTSKGNGIYALFNFMMKTYNTAIQNSSYYQGGATRTFDWDLPPKQLIGASQYYIPGWDIENSTLEDIMKDIQFKTVLDVLNSLIESIGGYMFVTFENGTRTLRFYNDSVVYVGVTTLNSIPIAFADNLIDLTQTNDMTNIASVIYPLGKQENNSTGEDDNVDSHKGELLTEALVLDTTIEYRKAFDENGVMYTVYSYKYVNPDDPDDTTQPINYNVTGPANYIVYTMEVGPGSKYIISTMNNRGFGCYALVNSYGEVLESVISSKTTVFTTVVDKVVTVPSGIYGCKLIVGYGSSYGTYKIWEYINDDDTSDAELKKHLSEDYLVKYQSRIVQRFGCVTSDGVRRIYSEDQSEGSNIKATDVLYSNIPVVAGKSYVYTGAQRYGHAILCLRNGTEAADIITASSGAALTYKHNQKYTVPNISGVLTVEIGSVIGNNYPHFYKYEEDEVTNKLEKYVTVESVNNNVPWITNSQLLSKYGRIEKIVEFNDISSPSVLMDKAQNWFKDAIKDSTKLSIKALDASIMSSSAKSYLPFQQVHIISKPHGVDKVMRVKRSELHLDKPENSTYEFEEPV